MQLSDAIRAIKDRLSIADLVRRYTDLRQHGARFMAPCPFHQETKPSFYVDEARGTFYCFGCQAAGDLIEFYMRINGLDFREAINQLAAEANVSIDAGSSQDREGRQRARTAKQALLAMHEDAAARFRANLSGDCGRECREYVQQRGLSGGIQEAFGLGWADGGWHDLEQFFSRKGYDRNLACEGGLLGKSARGDFYDRFRARLMFPIRDLANRTIAFGGRIIADSDEAKYINTADTPIYGKKEHLYGLVQARKGIVTRASAILTEGYMDVLTLHQYGYVNSVGVLGTALTEEQIRRISGFTSRVELLFDGDNAGRKATLRACEMFLARGLSCKVIVLPEGEDIDSLLRSSGPESFEKLRAGAPDGMEWCIQSLRQMAPRDAVAWARSFLSSIRVPELVSPYASLFARRMGIDEKEFRQGLKVETVPGRRECGDAIPNYCERDTQIILYAVRYPERLDDLRDLGADLALTHPRSRQFWEVLTSYDPEEVVYHLDERQREFWQAQRAPGAPPLTSGDLELACLKESLEKFYIQSRAASLDQALNTGQSKDFAQDLQYLQAIKDMMRTDNEQH